MVNRERSGVAIAIPDGQKMSMVPEVVAVVVVGALRLTTVVAAVAAADMVAVVRDAELNYRFSLFHVRGEAQSCHSTDCESCRDDDIYTFCWTHCWR